MFPLALPREMFRFLGNKINSFPQSLLRKIVLRDLRDFLEASLKFFVFILGLCVTDSVMTVCQSF